MPTTVELLNTIPDSLDMNRYEKHLTQTKFTFHAGENYYYTDAFVQLPNGDVEIMDFCVESDRGFTFIRHNKCKLILHGTWQLTERKRMFTITSPAT